MLEVWSSNNVVAAELVCSLLKEHGIPAQVDVTTPLGVVGTLHGFGAYASVRIANPEDYDAARRIVLSYEPEPSHCPTCGYDLTGLPEPRCPECGQMFSRRPERPEWSCPDCGEKLEGQFTHCWNCGSPRPEPESPHDGTDV
jgi:hypothetical protein